MNSQIESVYLPIKSCTVIGHWCKICPHISWLGVGRTLYTFQHSDWESILIKLVNSTKTPVITFKTQPPLKRKLYLPPKIGRVWVSLRLCHEGIPWETNMLSLLTGRAIQIKSCKILDICQIRPYLPTS